MKVTYKNGVFVPGEPVHVPEGYVAELSLPGLTPGGNLQGSAAASRELVRVSRETPPLDAETREDFRRALMDGERPPAVVGIFDDLIEECRRDNDRDETDGRSA